jgi:hypothetical protein
VNQLQTEIPTSEEQADNPELAILTMLENSLLLCHTVMEAAKPEIVYGYPEICMNEDEPYIHAGKLILHGVEHLKESIAVYKNILRCKAIAIKNKEYRTGIPF